MNILEAKLSAADRKNLPDSGFGLPKQRKFPLNDESHVESAIKFFKYAKPDERRELAKNINLKLKKFNMTNITVSPNNLFHKYVDRNYLKESFNIIEEGSFSYTKGSNKNPLYDMSVYNIMIQSENYTDESVILTMENTIYNILKQATDTGENLLKFLHDINNVFEIVYADYLNYKQYSTDTTFINLYYPLLNDLRSLFMKRLSSNDKCIDFKEEVSLYCQIREKVTQSAYEHNWFYLYRVNSEIYFNALYLQSKNVEIDESVLDTFRPELDIFRIPKSINIEYNVDDLPFCVKSRNFESVKNALICYKKQLESDLYVLTKTMNINKSSDNFSLYLVRNDELSSKLEKIQNRYIRKNRLLHYTSEVDFDLSEIDILRLQKTKYINRLFYSEFTTDEKFWVGTDEDSIYIIGKVSSDDSIKYKLLDINDGVFNYLLGGTDKPKGTVITITYPSNENFSDIDIQILYEGMSIDEDGNVKIIINPKKSYMDEYAETHRVLVENYKNKNYEAMKYNIAFMFLLISIIERDNRYIKREPEIVKARAFAINDFKTYLAHIQKAEPTFNFEKYYKESDFDKYIIDIPKTTILGVKNLLKTILL